MAFPTLTAQPAYPIGVEQLDSVVRTPFEAGYVQTRRRYTRQPRKFTIHYPFMSATDRGTLDTHFNVEGAGGAAAFDWINPENTTTYSVRYSRPIVYSMFTKVRGEIYSSCDIELEEV